MEATSKVEIVDDSERGRAADMRVTIQSVLYGNEPHHIERAAEALANSASRAVIAGVIAGWEYRLGDCAPEPTLSGANIARISALVEASGGKAHYTHFGANLGSAAGHNRLASESETEFLIILNPDVRMDPDTVQNLMGALGTDVGIVEARQLPLDHPKEYERYTGDTSWASTACALTRRSVFDKVDGFDAETFFLYGDDVDYSWRVRLAGYRVVFEPSARAFHDKRLTVAADWPASAAEQYYSAESALMMAHKYSMSERVAVLLDAFSKSRVSYLERAAKAFRDKQLSGTLPDPIDPGHTVAQFVGDYYAEHRF